MSITGLEMGVAEKGFDSYHEGWVVIKAEMPKGSGDGGLAAILVYGAEERFKGGRNHVSAWWAVVPGGRKDYRSQAERCPALEQIFVAEDLLTGTVPGKGRLPSYLDVSWRISCT
jgi:hypothetical protein